MKRLIFIILPLILLACRRESVPEVTAADQAGSVPLVLLAEGVDDYVTKAGVQVTTTANLASFYAAATTGAAGSEVSAWSSTEFTKSGDSYIGGKYWPISNPGYHFYASNCPLVFHAGGSLVQASNNADVICAYKATPSYKEDNTLVFKHIFARIGVVTAHAQDGYTLSNVSIRISPQTGGKYNLRTGDGKTDGTGWSELTTGSAVELTSGAIGSKDIDLYLVPGTYTLTATWTATRGDYVETFTAKTTQVNLEGSKISNLTATLGGQAVAVKITVSVSDWSSGNLTATFPLS